MVGEIVWRVGFFGGIYITAELWFWDSVIKWVIISAGLVCGVEVYIFVYKLDRLEQSNDNTWY